eukprot:31281-Eustigmatos_ZCMA.PRE.1
MMLACCSAVWFTLLSALLIRTQVSETETAYFGYILITVNMLGCGATDQITTFDQCSVSPGAQAANSIALLCGPCRN